MNMKTPDDDKRWKHHNWSGWPGAYCTKCFINDPIEQALADNNFIDVKDDSEMGFHYEFPNITCPPCINEESPFNNESESNKRETGEKKQ